MKTVTKIDKNTNVWVSDKNSDPVPGIEFSFDINHGMTTEEVYIYYNCIDGTWFGEHIAYGEWLDLDDDTLKWYIDKYDLKARIHDDH